MMQQLSNSSMWIIHTHLRAVMDRSEQDTGSAVVLEHTLIMLLLLVGLLSVRGEYRR